MVSAAARLKTCFFVISKHASDIKTINVSSETEKKIARNTLFWKLIKIHAFTRSNKNYFSPITFLTHWYENYCEKGYVKYLIFILSLNYSNHI